MTSIESQFVKKNVPRLLRRYEISYCKEDDCVEYFVTNKSTHEQISYALIFSLNRHSKEIHVSKFCPRLHKEERSKYLSAACFYLLIHHFGNIFHLGKGHSIGLETRRATYDAFFGQLKDFDLKNKGLRWEKNVSVLGEYPPIGLDTSMIQKETMGNEEVPFQV